MEQNFNTGIARLIKKLINSGQLVDPGDWQAVQIGHKMQEILFQSATFDVHDSIELLVKDINPDLPWCDDHFQERVGGIPTNPGDTYMNWPHYKQDEKWRKDSKFSHTYQERMWSPEFGNLADVVNLLQRNPHTRQAYLPLWFPQDTGNVDDVRVPCTLGYLFFIRRGYIHMQYNIRSVDVVRHLKNDLYMASRLLLWMRDQVNESLGIGQLVFHTGSLHCFDSDLYKLKKQYR